MSRNEYTNLLVELRDGGVLTEQEYSIAYGGTLPSREQGTSWPMGRQTGNFMQLVQERAQQCQTSAAAGTEPEYSELLASAYGKLDGILQALASAERETASAPETSEASEGHYSAEFYRLYEQLKQDEDYMAMAAEDYTNGVRVPYNKEIFREYLRSEPELLETYAQYQWTFDAQHQS